ncbi:MAG: putative toxin-antitoxin system toxin component, PIN family [Candidatus Omnitrophota bacterium]|nr:putative toxin-antitoxin system toxin component, PIN family [Candidatus Omnitrophota bacterium]
MRRLVLDTNVVVSALLFDGPPAALVRLVVEGELVSLTSPSLLAELQRVLVSKFQYPPSLAELAVTEWRALSEHVEPTVTLAVVAQDPSDNRVLECAVSAHAEAIVSGDKHLLALKSFRGIPILSPHAFLAQRR